MSRALPGIAEGARFGRNLEARVALADALAAGNPPCTLCMHVEPDQVSCERRSVLADRLRRGGVSKLANRIERALVPVGSILGFVDTDGATQLVLIPLAGLR